MASKNNFLDLMCPLPAVIANGGTVSAEVDLIGTSVCGMVLPAAFSGTSVTFQTAIALGGTYQPLYDSTNTQVSIPVTQARNYSLNPATFAAWRYIRVVSSTAEGAERTVTLVCRQV